MILTALEHISNAVTLDFSIYLANVTAIQPLPEPISNIFSFLHLYLIIKSTNSSVSGLGIRTELSKSNSSLLKIVFPKTYCIGSFLDNLLTYSKKSFSLT